MVAAQRRSREGSTRGRAASHVERVSLPAGDPASDRARHEHAYRYRRERGDRDASAFSCDERYARGF